MRDALEAFLELCLEGDYEYVRSDAGNTRLVTALGTSKPTFLVPRSLSMRGFEDADTVYVAGIEGLKDFSPRLVADGLAGRPLCAGKKLIPVVLPAPFRLQRDLGTLDLARHLDSSEGVEWLIRELSRATVCSEGTPTILIPPILGTQPNNTDAWPPWKRASGMPVHEIVALAPAVTACDCTRCSTVCSGNTGWM